jgi:hypothetical protein
MRCATHAGHGRDVLGRRGVRRLVPFALGEAQWAVAARPAALTSGRVNIFLFLRIVAASINRKEIKNRSLHLQLSKLPSFLCNFCFFFQFVQNT